MKEQQIRLIKLGCMVLVGMAIWFIPPPPGLEPEAWKIFSAYIVAILGIILRPYSSPVVMLGVLGIYGLLLGPAPLLGGFSSTTTWQVVAAFMISSAFIATGLGRRISYLLIGKVGKTSLGMGYALAFSDLTLGLAIPSTTARAGGVVYPIFNSLSKTLGSTVEEGTSRKLAAFLTIVAYHINLTTASVFLTGMAPNVQIAAFADEILGVTLDWATWAKMGIVPGIALTLLIPFVLYKVFPPEIKKIDNYKQISKEGIDEIGPMSVKEKLLLVFFVGVVLLWATTSLTGFNSTAVAMAFLAMCLLFGVVSWDDIRKNKGAWDTLIWYGAIIGISSSLSSAGFFSWLAEVIQQYFDFSGINKVLMLLILVVIGLLVRYVFASSSVFTTSMMPVLYTIGMVAELPVFPLAMLMASMNGYGAMLTNYGGSCGPVLFGYGHIDMKTWWKLGTISTVLSVAVHFLISLPYWKLIGLW